jgi:hypothetical protein
VSRNVQPGILSHPSRALAPYRTHFDITVLPDPIEVDGATCVVVELRLKPVEGMPPQGHIEMAFARDTGMLRRTLNFDADGKETGRTMITDVELGIEIDDARFAYTPPEDVVVDDLTGEMGRKPHGPRRTQGPPTEDE